MTPAAYSICFLEPLHDRSAHDSERLARMRNRHNDEYMGFHMPASARGKHTPPSSKNIRSVSHCVSYTCYGIYGAMALHAKPLEWVGSSYRDLMDLPAHVRRYFGYALSLAQHGEQCRTAKNLRGFGGTGVLEVIENDAGGTYRAVYTVKFEEAVFVLHCFQKKSKSGIATPKADMELIRARLKVAEAFAKELRHAKTID